MNEFIIFNEKTFMEHINSVKIKRKIRYIQLHHTYSPSYSHFDGNNHMVLQRNMKNYHVKTNGWTDIAQHFTIFPDGKILSGRNLDTAPAGIYGANSNGICIECLGNFDKNGDTMTESQKSAIVCVVRTLLDKFNLKAESGVTYHSWWSSDGRDLGDYVKGHSVKTCPGTDFFGGNTLTAYEKNLMPLIENYKYCEDSELTEITDIINTLNRENIVTDTTLWTEKCNKDINIYWLCRKMANRVKKSA